MVLLFSVKDEKWIDLACKVWWDILSVHSEIAAKA